MAYTDIDKPTDYFNTKLYTGNGGTQNITGLDFAPDWVWLKSRSNGNYHNLCDTVRGVNKQLYSNDTTAEASKTTVLTAFNSDGFTLGSESDINGSARTFVSWNWLASNTTASNTDGSITSTVSANTTSGFSIVSYTSTGSNATVGHVLGVAPSMMIFKRRSGDTENWPVYHKDMGATHIMLLNATDAKSDTATRFNDTEPTSSVFSLGTSGDTNGGTSPFIAYCFAEKKGFSKFGSYTGNGNADGTFIYTGFKPAWVMIKRTDDVASWTILDNKRDSFNVTEKRLFPDDASAEVVSANGNTDFLSNGVKIRTSHIGINLSGATYIYMAFAEAPLVGTNNVPCTAR